MKDLNIFLLMGQSNMAGRGYLHSIDELSHPDVYMWREGQWLPAKEPLHTDKPDMAGVGLGMSFAVEIANNTSLSPVGLVPCAVGGSPLRRWMPDGDLYTIALEEAEAALQFGSLAGLLWHQGEHDSCDQEMTDRYGERLQTMVAQLRHQLDAEDVPFIAGELGPFLCDFTSTVHYQAVNDTLRNVGAHIPNYACVRADGLTDRGDTLHFDATSLRAFGVRYAKAFEMMLDR